jgi:hypothetical protein
MANRGSPLATAFYCAVLAGSAFGLAAAAQNRLLDGHSDAVNDAAITASAAGITAYRVRQWSLK